MTTVRPARSGNAPTSTGEFPRSKSSGLRPPSSPHRIESGIVGRSCARLVERLGEHDVVDTVGQGVRRRGERPEGVDDNRRS